MQFTDEDYNNFTIAGCKRFYCDIGIESSWATDFSYEIDTSSTPTSSTPVYIPTLNKSFNLLQSQYCLTSSEIEFFKCVKNYWNTMVSYTTDALRVANAHRPYDFLSNTIKDRERMLIDLFFKMDNTSMSQITDIDPAGFSIRW